MADGIAGCARKNQARWSGLEIIQTIARGKRIGAIGRAGGRSARSATAQIGLDIGDRRNGVLRRLVFQSPSLLGAINLAQVIDARALLRFQARADEIGYRDGGEQADDGNDNHDFHEGKAPSPFNLHLHTILTFIDLSF